MWLFARYLAVIVLFCVATQSANSGTGAEEHVLPPLGHTYFCMQYPADCEKVERSAALPQQPSARFQELARTNTNVNDSIAPQPDPDPIDRDWLIAPTGGDCDDYAVTKRHELLQQGWPSSSLLLAEVTLLATGEHHLILVVKGEKADWVLDNLRPTVVRLAQTRNEYAWDKIESADNPRYWTKSFAGLG